MRILIEKKMFLCLQSLLIILLSITYFNRISNETMFFFL